MSNLDDRTVAAYSASWSEHDRARVRGRKTALNVSQAFDDFFSIFPLAEMSEAEGFDLGCGMGRIARLAAPRVGRLHCIDPAASAIEAARKVLDGMPNATFHLAGVDDIPLSDASQDFAYSLGVLHHVPDTADALRKCVRKLKPGAPFLVYLYYSFDNRPRWFRLLWRASDIVRQGVSRMPFQARKAASDAIALFAYWPLSRTALLLEKAGFDVASFPLGFYRDSSLRVLRADSLDRFGTPLEQRFSRSEIEAMMIEAGLTDIRFREAEPYWVAVGRKCQN